MYVFRDRLEISSPGRLQNTLNLEKILTGNSAPRNQFLLKYLDNMQYMDSLGRGFRWFPEKPRKIFSAVKKVRSCVWFCRSKRLYQLDKIIEQLHSGSIRSKNIHPCGYFDLKWFYNWFYHLQNRRLLYKRLVFFGMAIHKLYGFPQTWPMSAKTSPWRPNEKMTKSKFGLLEGDYQGCWASLLSLHPRSW